MMISKADQLNKNKEANPKKLSKTENKLFHDDILEISEGTCQLCLKCKGEDFHHPKYGSYGADKDDTCQVLACRICHDVCHEFKHGPTNMVAAQIGDLNWAAHDGR